MGEGKRNSTGHPFVRHHKQRCSASPTQWVSASPNKKTPFSSAQKAFHPWAWVKNRYPKWNSGKRNQGLKPAVPWCIFEPYPWTPPIQSGGSRTKEFFPWPKILEVRHTPANAKTSAGAQIQLGINPCGSRSKGPSLVDNT